MKTVIIILITLALIVSFDIAVNNFFEKEMRYYNDNISSAVKNIENGNYSEAFTSIDDIETQWNKNKSKWNMLCDHYEIEQITLIIRTVKIHYEENNIDEVLTDLEEMQCYLSFTSERYNILAENIL